MKKDEEKELKKKQVEGEKEEKKKQAEAKLEAQTEKERVAAEKQSQKDRIKSEEEAKLSKQKNLMLNMFGGAKPTARPSTPSRAAQAASAERIVDLTVSSSESVGVVTSENGGDAATEEEMTPEFDTDAFLASLHAGMTMQECVASRSNRFALSTPDDYLKTTELRQPVQLRVLLSAVSTGYVQEGYSEEADVLVDPFMRTFSFADDHKRPFYYGTRSKFSSIISGRRPFVEDHNAVNYDYDSEDDYDDDADGEDIAESEDEDDEGGNDLEYDEFFRHDNDFGSDADSDGEIMAAVAMKSRPGEEKIGLRFLRDETWQWQQHPRGAASSSSSDPQSYGMKVVMDEQAVGQPAIMTACFETEKDVVRLRNYGCVVFANACSMPYRGWTESQPKKSSKAEAAEKEK